MPISALLLLAAFATAGQPAASADAVYAPLWLYNGTWQVAKEDLAAGAKPDTLLNQCARVGSFFTCQQTVNGTAGALLIFIPSKTAGQYYTQSVTPDGRAQGRGDLTISGDKWVYSSSWNQGGGKTTYYRTTNTFTGKTKIRYEQQESADNKEWKTTGSGNETRVNAGKTTVAR